MKRDLIFACLLSTFVLLLVWIKPAELADPLKQSQNSNTVAESSAEEEKSLDKRSSNWAKTGSMWGKRGALDQDEDDDSSEEMTKRGWEKAGSMWGKRAGNNWSKASGMWGKRNNNWAKAGSMWGKRR